MRVIQITDEDAQALVEKLELTELRQRLSPQFTNGEVTKTQMFDRVHEVFHYEVVKWLQDQGVRLHG